MVDGCSGRSGGVEAGKGSERELWRGLEGLEGMLAVVEGVKVWRERREFGWETLERAYKGDC